MTPYYADDRVTLYHGDCLEVIPEVLSSGAVHTLLTDPPFFMPTQQYAGRTAAWQRSWSDTSILASWWQQFIRCAIAKICGDGHFYAFCDHASYAVFYPAVYTNFANVACLTWDKGRPGMGTAWRASTEFIIAARGRTAYWSGGAAGTVLRHTPVSFTERVHPVDKPVPLLRDLLRPSTPPGGLVLDPFVGGGSTLIAARDLGMRVIGIEADEAYCEIAARRLAQDVLPLEAS
jgi:site-specific DNA-methyltransferase (adenine-specific)